MDWDELNKKAVVGDRARCGAFRPDQFIIKMANSGYIGNWYPINYAEKSCLWNEETDWSIIKQKAVI